MRRTAQIEHWLRDQAGVQVTRWTAAPTGLVALPSAPLWCLRTLAASALAWRGLSWKGRAKLMRVAPALALALHRQQPDVVVVETAPSYSMLAALLLARLQLPYVVVPHNIECLVPGAVHGDFASRGGMLDAEALIARQAQASLAISLLDLGLLQTMGGRGVLFPYFPTDQEVLRFEAIRVRRCNTAKRGVLVLGSVSNQPTLDGMRELISELADTPPFGGEPMQLAGYRTELLQAGAPAGVVVLGTVSVPDLDALLTTVRCVVLRQPFTTGGLTRLVELNLCGLPVVMVGNYLQGRGQDAFGVYTFDHLPDRAGFATLMQKPETLRYPPPRLTLSIVLSTG